MKDTVIEISSFFGQPLAQLSLASCLHLAQLHRVSLLNTRIISVKPKRVYIVQKYQLWLHRLSAFLSIILTVFTPFFFFFLNGPSLLRSSTSTKKKRTVLLKEGGNTARSFNSIRHRIGPWVRFELRFCELIGLFRRQSSGSTQRPGCENVTSTHD